jgi:hypothetical protein
MARHVRPKHNLQSRSVRPTRSHLLQDRRDRFALSSIQRTQQVLNQAQRIAHDVQQIDHVFTTTYAPSARRNDRMEALRRSVGGAKPAEAASAPKKPARRKKASAGQKEMLMPIVGKKPAKDTAAKKPGAGRQRKSA